MESRSPSRPLRALVICVIGETDITKTTSGAELRNYWLARQLSSSMEVTLLGVRREAGSTAYERLQVAGGEGRPIEVHSVPRPGGYGASQLLRGLFGRAPISLLNYHSPALLEALRGQLEGRPFDLVHVESIHLAACIDLVRAHPQRPRVLGLDWHNIESELMRRYASHEGNIFRRTYAWQTALKLRAVEREVLARPDMVHLAVSRQEAQRLGEGHPGARVFVVPNGVDCAAYSDASLEEAYSRATGRPAAAARRFRILYVGAMNYHANIDAAGYFVQRIWPAVRRAAPGLVCTIAGRAPGAAVRDLSRFPGVEVTGRVDDVRPFYRESVAAVVPLRVGGGSRLKILESMAAGVPVVASAVGAEGLEARGGTDLLIAETPEEYAGAIRLLLQEPERARGIVESARALVRERYDWPMIGAALRGVYESLLGPEQARREHQLC